MNKRLKLTPPTPEEDAAITAAALRDPDNRPLTDKQLAQMQPMRGRRGHGGTQREWTGLANAGQ